MAVSVILKALNEEARIGPALESVLAALEGIGGEAIVADGGSRDQTLAIAAKYPVRIVQLEPAIAPTCGIGPQLGFQYSREPFVCLMDGDMLLDPGFLPDALAWLANNPGAAGVTGHVVEMNDTSLEYVRRGRRVSPENRIGEIDRMNGGGLTGGDQAGRYLSDRNLHGYEELISASGCGRAAGRCTASIALRPAFRACGQRLCAARPPLEVSYLRGIGELLRAAFGKPQWKRWFRTARTEALERGLSVAGCDGRAAFLMSSSGLGIDRCGDRRRIA